MAFSGETVIHQSERTRVTRRVSSGFGGEPGSGGVVRKEPIGRDADGRLRHEIAILGRLAEVEGFPRLVEGVQPPGALELVDDHAAALAEANLPLPPGEVVRL